MGLRKKSNLLGAYDKLRGLFAGRFTKFNPDAPIPSFGMPAVAMIDWNRKPVHVELPPMNVMECQECGSPGSTLCPYHVPGEKNLTDLPISTKQELINWWIEYGTQNEPRIIPMSDTTRPQQDPREGKTSVTDLVLKDIEERRKQGIAKYGTELKTDNGRDALVDLYQELLDAVMYVRQRLEEVEELRVKMGVKKAQLEQMEMFDPVTLTPTVDYVARAFAARPGTFFPVTVSDVIAPGIVVTYPAPTVSYTPTPDPNRESILEEAQRLVHGDRGKDYGHPIFDMTRSADMLTALLRDKLRTGMRLEAEDIAQAMICVKQSRERNQPKRDNNTDTAGYAEVKQMLKEWRDAHPGEDPRNHF